MSQKQFVAVKWSLSMVSAIAASVLVIALEAIR